MMIWILALVIFGCLGLAGFSFGVIRAGFSLIGLLFASVLAFPLGHLLNPILGLVGEKNPFFAWLTGPLIMFVLIVAAFKIAGLMVHRKVDVHYKYKAGDLRMGLWNRLSPRLGLCLGLINGTIYLILISMVIYVFSYATSQMVIGDNGSWSVRMLNMLGNHAQQSGMARIAAAIDPMPDSYYQAVDMVGLIYHNDLLEGRLARYPAFLSLAEQPQFQDIANDQEFAELRQKQPPFADIINHPKAQAILGNPDMLKQIWAIVVPNFKDLNDFLRTGQSATFDDQKILGRWSFDLNGALNVLKRAKPDLAPADMLKLKRVMIACFAKTTLVAAPDKQVYVKNFGMLKPAVKPNALPTVEMQTLSGQWAEDGNNYQITIGSKPLQAVVEGDKLTITGDPLPMRFDKEY